MPHAYHPKLKDSTILQVIPALGAGGAEQACLDVASALTAAGARAFIIANGGTRQHEAQRMGARFLTHPVHSKNPARILANARVLATLIRREKVSVVHARSRAPAWSAWLACRATRTPFVTTMHAAYKGNTFAPKKLYNSVMARGDRVIAISPFIARYATTHYGLSPPRLVTINRCVDLARFNPTRVDPSVISALRLQWGVEETTRLALMPARLSRIKGQDVFLRALTTLPPDVVGIVAGDDQGRTGWRCELDTLVNTLGLQHRVRFVPHITAMPDALATASVVVVASRVAEGFGRVALEAMAMGVPVVAPESGALVDTITHGVTGFLAPSEDVTAFAHAMTAALTMTPDERQRLSAAACQQAQDFSLTAMLDATLDVYENCIDARCRVF